MFYIGRYVGTLGNSTVNFVNDENKKRLVSRAMAAWSLHAVQDLGKVLEVLSLRWKWKVDYDCVVILIPDTAITMR